MTDNHSPKTPGPRGSTRPQVHICFEDETINEIFSQLLEARGYRTKILAQIEDLKDGAHVITEPRFFHKLDKTCHERCLVIGNKDALRSITALSLSRPLTEEKIEQALSQFLGE